MIFKILIWKSNQGFYLGGDGKRIKIPSLVPSFPSLKWAICKNLLLFVFHFLSFNDGY